MSKTLTYIGGSTESGLNKGLGLVEMFFQGLLDNQNDSNCQTLPKGVALVRVDRELER